MMDIKSQVKENSKPNNITFYLWTLDREPIIGPKNDGHITYVMIIKAHMWAGEYEKVI